MSFLQDIVVIQYVNGLLGCEIASAAEEELVCPFGTQAFAEFFNGLDLQEVGHLPMRSGNLQPD